MQSTEESVFLRHESCPNCGSRNNLARYSDGHAHCFGCGHFESGDGNTRMTDTQRQKNTNLVDGEFKALPSRKITEDTCRFWGYQVGYYSGKAAHLGNFYKSGVKIAQQIRLPEKNFPIIGPVTDLLYGAWLWGSGKKLVITEGYLDAMSVSQVQNHKWPVVSVPNGAAGAANAIRKNLKWLEDNFEEIVLMFDMDEDGQKAALECAPLFSPGKCSIASLPLKDANELLVAGRGQEIINAIWKAKPYKPDGIVSISDLIDKIGQKPEMGDSFPWPTLTSLTYGMKPGQVWVWTTGSGMGKTEFFKTIAPHLVDTHDRKIGIIFLEEEAQETAVALAAKHNKTNYNDPEAEYAEEEIKDAVKRIEEKDKYIFFDAFGHDDYESIKSVIRHMVISHGCEYIFLDHLTAFIDGLPSSEANALAEKMSKELATMTRELKFNLQTIAHIRKSDSSRKPAEEGGRVKIDDIKGSGAFKQWANYIIALERNLQAEDRDERHTTTIRILKARNCGKNAGSTLAVKYNEKTAQLTEVGDVFGDEGGTEDCPF